MTVTRRSPQAPTPGFSLASHVETLPLLGPLRARLKPGARALTSRIPIAA